MDKPFHLESASTARPMPPHERPPLLIPSPRRVAADLATRGQAREPAETPDRSLSPGGYRLEIDPLVVAAIEHSARVRHRKIAQPEAH